jgi:hypothetical protein
LLVAVFQNMDRLLHDSTLLFCPKPHILQNNVSV